MGTRGMLSKLGAHDIEIAYHCNIKYLSLFLASNMKAFSFEKLWQNSLDQLNRLNLL